MTASPSTTPTPSTPTRRDLVVTSIVDSRPDNEIRIRIIDEGRRLTDAQAATLDLLKLNLGALFSNQIAILSLDKEGRSILVLWTGFACDESATLTVGPAGDTVTISPDPIGGCDLVGTSRGVVLTFAEAPLRLNLETTPLVEPS
ncbi:MAG: hypothetical protein Q8M74_04155 [Chloroflexota bacterium]|nr:hypothetical protein [Chloroflexota bacterium]